MERSSTHSLRCSLSSSQSQHYATERLLTASLRFVLEIKFQKKETFLPVSTKLMSLRERCRVNHCWFAATGICFAGCPPTLSLADTLFPCSAHVTMGCLQVFCLFVVKLKLLLILYFTRNWRAKNVSDKRMYLRGRKDSSVVLVFRGPPWKSFLFKNKLIKC